MKQARFNNRALYLDKATKTMIHAAVLLALNCCSAAPVVVVTPTNAPAVSGTLVKLDGQEVVVNTDGKKQSFPVAALLSIRTSLKPTTAVPKIRVQLVDNSTLLAREFTTSKRQASFVLADGRKTTVTTRSIANVRWMLSPQLDASWKEVVQGKRSGDSIVVRDGKSLDELEGILNDITAERVGFTYEGKQRRIGRKRLAGIIYFHPGDRSLPDPICKVTEVSGSQWLVRSMTLQGERLAAVTVSGEKLTIAADQLVQLDFSTGNLLYLSDLEAQSTQWRPYVENASSQNLRLFFQPRRNIGFGGKPLQLGKQRFAKGFAVYSRTVMVFRLPGRFKQLTGVAGINQKQGRGHVTLIIRGDNKQLLKKDIAAGDKPLPFNLKMTGVRRLTVIVDFGKNLDVGDQLQLCGMRITK